jgi:N-acetylneuraminic acid mutarotase
MNAKSLSKIALGLVLVGAAGCGGGDETSSDGGNSDGQAVDGPGGNSGVSNGPNLITPRERPEAVLLAPGKVLVAGGSTNNGTPTNAAEIFENNTWTATPLMNALGRENHTLTLLADGRALAAGGSYYFLNAWNTAEVYVGGSWSNVGNMTVDREQHTATLLDDGRVLITGGCGDNGCTEVGTPLASAEIFDGANFSSAGSMSTARFRHTATKLQDGKVLVCGGAGTRTCDLFNPSNDSWSTAASMSVDRDFHRAMLLSDGRVLVVAGTDGSELSSAELYDPGTNSWSSAGSLLQGRYLHTATKLGDDRVITVAGRTVLGTQNFTSIEMYDPGNGSWSKVADLSTRRDTHGAIFLEDSASTVLIFGGRGMGGDLASVELYRP